MKWMLWLLIGSFARPALADKETPLESTPLAHAFAAAPNLNDLRLSPDGKRISFLQAHPQGMTVARALDTSTGKVTLLMAGKPNEFDIAWCDWANDERLVCSLRGLVRYGLFYYPATRIVAVNADGTQMKVLHVHKPTSANLVWPPDLAQFQDNIVDWLVKDDRHVLVQVPSTDASALARLDIYSGELSYQTRDGDRVRDWVSDGRGEPRLYRTVDETNSKWYVREMAGGAWTLLHTSALADLDDAFEPIGFALDPNELLYYDRNDGRVALYSMDLANGRQTQLVFAHPEVDVSGILALGKYRRLVGVRYVTDLPRIRYFDTDIEELHSRLQKLFPNELVGVTDEDWDSQRYLFFVSSDQDPGKYYLFDKAHSTYSPLGSAYPELEKQPLAPMTEIHYPARDGTSIQAYLTVPPGQHEKLPTVILPHGGPESRDVRRFDFLVQFLVANGYAVLQSNYRGSYGYGAGWAGQGGFKEWRQVISDITDGTRYLIGESIADPKRVCIVGWSYGGYAALMSGIEEPSLYRCVASIAGVTDLQSLYAIGGRATQAFIGTGPEIFKEGSPLERAAELKVPIALFHAEEDVNVPYSQSENMFKQLHKLDKQVEFFHYQHAEHDIAPERYRTDLLARLADFLHQNLGK